MTGWMRKFVALVGLAIAGPTVAQAVLKCEAATGDRSICNRMPSVCRSTYIVDVARKSISSAPDRLGDAASPLTVRKWTDDFIETADWSSELKDKDGRVVYQSRSVHRFNRLSGALLTFTEYLNAQGAALDDDSVQRLIAAGHGGLFGVQADRNVREHTCVASDRAF